ncbi:MAG: hypothetical protein WB660_03970 [Candidatus Sulfotelmatobacter sp.]
MVNSADLEFVCHVCNQPIKLETDLATDERGQSLHGDCFTKLIDAEGAEPQRKPSSTKAAD